jgi:hypothetical protein
MYLIIVYQNKEVLMKFFKISLLFSIGFIGLNMVTTSAGSRVGKDRKIKLQTNVEQAVDQEKAAHKEGSTEQTKTFSTAIVTGSTHLLLGIDPQLQTFLAPLQEKIMKDLAMKDLVQKIADYILNNYDQMTAKALVNQMFSQKDVSDSLTKEAQEKASILLNTLRSVLGEGIKTAVVEKLKENLLTPRL